MLHFPHPLTPPASDRPFCREIREAAPVEGVAPGIVGGKSPLLKSPSGVFFLPGRGAGDAPVAFSAHWADPSDPGQSASSPPSASPTAPPARTPGSPGEWGTGNRCCEGGGAARHEDGLSLTPAPLGLNPSLWGVIIDSLLH